MQIISAKSLSEQMQAGRVELIDVRTQMEYQEVHIEGAKNIPLDTLNVDDFIASRDESCIDSLCMICRSAVRGGKACEKLASAGLQRVFNLDGGMLAWEALELDVIRGRKVMSLERQVRIAAGFLVLAFCASRILWGFGVRWRGVDLCWDYRFLCNGNVDCKNAVESGVTASRL